MKYSKKHLIAVMERLNDYECSILRNETLPLCKICGSAPKEIFEAWTGNCKKCLLGGMVSHPGGECMTSSYYEKDVGKYALKIRYKELTKHLIKKGF